MLLVTHAESYPLPVIVVMLLLLRSIVAEVKEEVDENQPASKNLIPLFRIVMPAIPKVSGIGSGAFVTCIILLLSRIKLTLPLILSHIDHQKT